MGAVVILVDVRPFGMFDLLPGGLGLMLQAVGLLAGSVPTAPVRPRGPRHTVACWSRTS